ncbi:MAG: beta-ketoacyl-ACP synthase II [Dissulfurispiraceae bacterium]|nr:beta-ketoacyl-ACP synthase II [Dissulfurispiraceae bacterium]
MKRVVITGMGAVTPLGNSFAESWIAIKEGRSGIDVIKSFDVSKMPWKSAGQVKGFDPLIFLSRKESLHLDPFIHFAAAASLMAADDAELINHDNRKSAGVVIGSSRGGISSLENTIALRTRISPYLMPATTISMAASVSAYKLGAKGICMGISNACSSGTNAVGEAARLIRCGSAQIVFAGGSDAPVCPICLKGYGSAKALSKHSGNTASRPFDKRRDGFVLAEGACVLVLEEMEHAINRNAGIYAEIIGYANTTDSYHLTKPLATGESAGIQSALADAGKNPAEIDLISCHGTSTPIGDAVEAEAINSVFSKLYPAACGIKSSTGHMLAASGAFETACAVMSMIEGIVPATINSDRPDPDCRVNISDRMRTGLTINNALINSFGFGGVNAALVLKKF